MTHFTKSLGAGLAAAFMVVSAGQADAQGGRGYVSPWRPMPGSEQHNLLSPHADFIKSMRGCCTELDGRGNLEEVINDGHDSRFPKTAEFPEEDFPYIVIVTHDLKGKALDKPTIVHIPKDKVLSVTEAKSICKPMRIKDKDSTCIPPNFNVLWAYDNSQGYDYDNGKEAHRITNLYCYYPDPKMR
jgi:hypothetical protein